MQRPLRRKQRRVIGSTAGRGFRQPPPLPPADATERSPRPVVGGLTGRYDVIVTSVTSHRTDRNGAASQDDDPVSAETASRHVTRCRSLAGRTSRLRHTSPSRTGLVQTSPAHTASSRPPDRSSCRKDALTAAHDKMELKMQCQCPY